eukprot:g16498.t1
MFACFAVYCLIFVASVNWAFLRHTSMTGGAVTDGAVTDGDVTDGAVTDGAVMDSAVTDGTLTGGAVTDGGALFSDAYLTESGRLAVVVPTYSGDLKEAVAALSSWPTVCSAITLRSMQLVLYYSGTMEDGVWSEGIIRDLEQTGGRCFEQTRVVFADLDPEDNVFPKVHSVMFYTLFLEGDIVRSFEDYAALVILEWDVVVAHPTSFQRLFEAAFVPSEEFWMKGSSLAEADIHATAGESETWHVPGHLNGNAIYNNTDPGFKEFVNFTLNRWQYSYPYDVALWATLADFPYSQPLWQRYWSKFVSIPLIGNVGLHYVTYNRKAVSGNAPFLHVFAGERESTANKAEAHAEDSGGGVVGTCTSDCGLADEHGGTSYMSTFCDPSCMPEWSLNGPRFDGYGCGADDPARFGQSCRKCFTSQEAALAEEERLSSAEVMGPTTGVHVVMCATANPPPASECSDECISAADTVCDYRCERDDCGDLDCNWSGLGRTCRFCFHNAFEAYLADETAKLNGSRSRAIMCATHEPPVAMWSTSSPPDAKVGDVASKEASLPSPAGIDAKASDVGTANSAVVSYSGDITRGDLCAFMVGYFEFLPEASAAVSSVTHFMPGMKIGIATHPRDFHVYNRAVGHLPTVNVVNSSHVEHSSLNADKACGPGTRLIFYMGIGEVLSRSFTEKDTHTPRGDLIVAFTDTDELGNTEFERRALGAKVILGSTPPCFTYGTDLILPAELNERLRGILRSSTILDRARAQRSEPRVQDPDDDLTGDLAVLGARHRSHATIFIPEVLAALGFFRSPDTMEYMTPQQWSGENMIAIQSVWDVPLVKPKFGCSYDMGLSISGYDLAEKLTDELELFKLGLKCDTGFRPVQASELNIKINNEFGVAGALQEMPDLEEFRISVMYRTFFGDSWLFEMSIQTVFRYFPNALELVAVVIEEDEALFEDIMDRHRASAPFPLRVVTEPDLMDGHIQQKYSKLRADLYTRGDYVMHLDSDVVLLEDITYSHIFHLRKPVLPYRRYRTETATGLQVSTCWQNGTSIAIGEEVLHEYSIFNTHVYPRAMYSAARDFIEEHHKMSFVDFMSTRSGKCMDAAKMFRLKPQGMFSDFNFMGAFLWYHMHDAVYWLPADPYDTLPGQYRPDLSKYAWPTAVARVNAAEERLEEHFENTGVARIFREKRKYIAGSARVITEALVLGLKQLEFKEKKVEAALNVNGNWKENPNMAFNLVRQNQEALISRVVEQVDEKRRHRGKAGSGGKER